jgi:hypothetical protein
VVSNSTVSSSTRSRTIKRDNSCVMIISHDEVTWGLVQTIFSFKGSSRPSYYSLVSLLPRASQQVCSDKLTNARLDEHLVACEPPR